MGHFLLFPAPHGGGFVAFCMLLKLIPTYIPGWGGSGFTLTGALHGQLGAMVGIISVNKVDELHIFVKQQLSPHLNICSLTFVNY